MARVTVEDCLQNVNNRFALVLLASKRARQILNGSNILVEGKNKAQVMALREIAAEKVSYREDVQEVLYEDIESRRIKK